MKLTHDLIGRIPRTDVDSGPTPLYLTDEQRAESLAATLADSRAVRPAWVFGYGSLIWKPDFPFAERRIGTVRGYHRQFCFWVKRFRGTPEAPGLMLGLEQGGVCRGIAYRVDDAQEPETLKRIWAREMLAGIYVPRWVDVQTEQGRVRAITFTINRHHERYAGRLSDDIVADHLAQACGHVGSCAEYLMETVAHLEELGIRDQRLWRLQHLVADRIARRFPSP
jgi:glutathione-specific gamma-glutamylcyclotransferase